VITMVSTGSRVQRGREVAQRAGIFPLPAVHIQLTIRAKPGQPGDAESRSADAVAKVSRTAEENLDILGDWQTNYFAG
jgi:hypothetical protein